jgi:hypothetical protein
LTGSQYKSLTSCHSFTPRGSLGTWPVRACGLCSVPVVDGQREAITAVDDRGIAGVARFARDDLDPAIAEVAILVADEWQHRALARQLLRPLAERARSAGMFRAAVLRTLASPSDLST